MIRSIKLNVKRKPIRSPVRLPGSFARTIFSLCYSFKICVLTFLLVGDLTPVRSDLQLQSSNEPQALRSSNIDNFNSTLFALRAEKMTAGEDLMFEEAKSTATFAEGRNSSKRSGAKRKSSGNKSSNKTVFDDEQNFDSSESNEIYDDVEDAAGSAGSQKEPECASHGRYYCTYKEDYPLKLVTEVTKYYKWPLEKLFRDLHAQIMPKLAHDSTGNLVCDSVTRVVRPGWARNTNERWLVVINNENYHQYVTEVVCQYGTNSRCNFIPPCYYSSCQQRYNTQKLLVIDPNNPYRGPFLSEFLFPSCCVCYVPSTSDSLQDRYRSAPATIYQRTLQQESASNLFPPQFRPPGLMEEQRSSATDTSPSSSGVANSPQPSQQNQDQVAAPGEIRRAGDQYKRSKPSSEAPKRESNALSDFPRLR